jgi:hypothetical protein
MSHTVIGIFDNQAEAQAAVAQLTSSGFTREYIDITQNAGSATSSYGGSDSSTGSYGSTSGSGASVTDKVGNFFSSMIDNKDDAHRYSNLARQDSKPQWLLKSSTALVP